MTIIDAPTTTADTDVNGPAGSAPAGGGRDWIAIARDVGIAARPGVTERDGTGEISATVYDQLRSTGITAALVPAEFGGGGVSHADMGAILREIARHDGPTAVALAMHSHVLAFQVWRHHRGMDAEKVFRKVVDDRVVLATTGASDWVGSNGRVERVDGGYRVHARKGPVSGCEVADVIATSFRWDAAPDGPQVLHCSLPIRTEGIRIERTWDTLGMRATGSHTLVFDDVFVPDAAISLTRPADAWPAVWNAILGCAMPLIMAGYLGIADEAAAIATTAAAGRTDAPTVQLLGELGNAHLTATDAVEAMLRESEDLRFANTDEHTQRVLSRKTVATEAMIDTVRIAAEVVGGLAYMRSSTMERLQRDILGSRYHPLPRAKQIEMCGRIALGLSPIG